MESGQNRTDVILERFYFSFDGTRGIKPVGPDWLIKDILEAGTIVQMFGTWAAYKTFVALDMALCIATGHPWHGHEVIKNSPVLYIAGEGRAKLYNRVLAWAEVFGEVPPGCFGVSSTPTQILDDDYYEALTIRVDETAQKFGTEPQIFLDTLSRNFGPGNETDTADMAFFLNRITTLCKSAVRFDVHHSGHGNKDRGRSSSVWPAGLDVEMKCEKVEGNQVRITWTKVKDGPYPQPVYLRPEVVALGEDKHGDAITSVVMRRGVDANTEGLGKALKKIYQLIREEIDRQGKARQENGQPPSGLYSTWVPIDTVRALAKGTKATAHFNRDLEALVARKILKQSGEMVFVNVDI